MRTHGIKGGFIRRALNQGCENPTVEELIDLRIHGERRAARTINAH